MLSQKEKSPLDVKRHILEIDVIRFFAAVLVVVFHLAYKSFVAPDDIIHRHIPRNITYTGNHFAAIGWIGVQIFFVISGFVISYSCQGEKFSNYVRRRVLRLAPGVWGVVPLCTVISILVFRERVGETLIGAVKTLLFIPLEPWVIGQFWTLPIEIVFYCMVAALIFFRKIDKLELFGVLIGLASSIYWLGDEVFHFPGHGQQFIRLLLLQHGIFFAIGVVIYHAGIRGLTPYRLTFLALMIAAAFFQIEWAAQWEAGGISPAFRSWVPFLIWLFCVCLMCVAAVRRNDKAELARPATARVVRQLGLATYPLYLVHFHIGGAMLLYGLDIGLPVVWAICAAVVVSIAASLFIARLVEPSLRYLVNSWWPLKASMDSEELTSARQDSSS